LKEAIRRIELILDPPKAEVGATYRGKVVNITKFGAFVNILPGRDGLLHISKLSKLSQGKRVERVEDVLSLGEDLDVRVDDVDPQGKVSLSLEDAAGDAKPAASAPSGPTPAATNGGGAEQYETVSFEETWEQEARSAFGDLGPASGLDAPAGAGSSAAPPSRSGEARGQGPRRNPRRRH
jgi:polyribonucleotide nucleotidyltransferase